MKRIHLFEFEDLSWFPNWLRQCLTRYLVHLHSILKTPELIVPLFERLLAAQPDGKKKHLDLCSGGGGPIVEVFKRLRAKGVTDFEITLSDLYPNQLAISAVEEEKLEGLEYSREPVDATNVGISGSRSMIASLHHMPPDVARKILSDAFHKRQPILIFEVCDNEAPLWISWTSFIPSFFMTMIFSVTMRPMTLAQFVFTYFIPLIPFFVAFDGMVSYMRTYTAADLDELLQDLQAEDYVWEKGIARKPPWPGMLYLVGLPQKKENC